MKRVLVIALLITFSLGTVAKAQAFSVPKIKVVLQHGPHQGEGRLPDDERQREEERRRLEEERRRKEEERRRQEEERRRQDEERRKQEERRRFEEEKRRQDDERRRQEDERRRQDEERRRHEDERRGPGHGPGHHERGWDERPGHQNGDRVKAREVLHETADLLARAQRVARFGRYRDGLGKAYAHQEEARNLFFEGRYQRAIAHSMRARQIANFIIEENRPGHRHASERHDHYEHDDDLDNQLSIKIVDDHVALKLKINLD